MPSTSSPLSRKQLAAHEATRNLAADLRQSIREMKAGNTQVTHSLATEARESTGLSQTLPTVADK